MTTLTSNELLHRPSSPNLGNVLYTASGKNFTPVILPNTTPTDEGHKVSSQVLHLIASLIKRHWEPISCDEHNFDNISTAWVINLSHSPLQSPQGIISFRFRISLYFAESKHCLFEHSKATSSWVSLLGFPNCTSCTNTWLKPCRVQLQVKHEVSISSLLTNIH